MKDTTFSISDKDKLIKSINDSLKEVSKAIDKDIKEMNDQERLVHLIIVESYPRTVRAFDNFRQNPSFQNLAEFTAAVVTLENQFESAQKRLFRGGFMTKGIAHAVRHMKKRVERVQHLYYQ